MEHAGQMPTLVDRNRQIFEAIWRRIGIPANVIAAEHRSSRRARLLLLGRRGHAPDVRPSLLKIA